jgi:hypothetical protein
MLFLTRKQFCPPPEGDEAKRFTPPNFRAANQGTGRGRLFYGTNGTKRKKR